MYAAQAAAAAAETYAGQQHAAYYEPTSAYEQQHSYDQQSSYGEQQPSYDHQYAYDGDSAYAGQYEHHQAAAAYAVPPPFVSPPSLAPPADAAAAAATAAAAAQPPSMQLPASEHPPPSFTPRPAPYVTSAGGGGAFSQAPRPRSPSHVHAGFNSQAPDKFSGRTNSKDPESMRARVFVGNINTLSASRHDVIELCRASGKLKGLTLFRGYAFVQYETKEEAQAAAKALHGQKFHNNRLEARLAAEEKPHAKGAIIAGPIRRPKHDFFFGGQRIRVETANIRNRGFAQDVFGVIKDINFHEHGKDDTLICGSCRSIFSNLNAYINHRRQKKCQFYEREVAPSSVSCFTCKEQFEEPWLFIQHLIHKHSINLYSGQPECDPIKHMEDLKKQKEEAEKAAAANAADEAMAAAKSAVAAAESAAAAAESAAASDEQDAAADE